MRSKKIRSGETIRVRAGMEGLGADAGADVTI
jgi:hypothetical protein